jgi:6,7-dimethyl-8-ribityllumazine synthase
LRIALIVSTYHAFITERLERGAREVLREAGLADGDVQTFHVPGAYELAQAALRVAQSGEWAAAICLGCLIRGETPHFEYIAQAASHGIMRAAQETRVPIAFGVLTTSTAEEALARAAEGPNNKGREAAAAALEMAKLYARIDATTASPRR